MFFELCIQILTSDIYHCVCQAEIETVAKVTHEKGKRNDTQENKYGETSYSFFESNYIHKLSSEGLFINMFLLNFFFSFCPAVQDHSNFKMCFPWKMKILMIWLLLTKRFLEY